MFVQKALLVLILALIPVWGARLGDYSNGKWDHEAADTDDRQLSEDFSFIVSQVSSSQDWCIVAPDLPTPYNEASFYESMLRFSRCEPYNVDDIEEVSYQLFQLRSDRKIESRKYPGMCMIVNDGNNIGGGVMRLDDCNINSNLNQFRLSSSSETLKLVSPNDDYCVTNEGSTPDEGDTIHAKRCGGSRRYKFDFVQARENDSDSDLWEIIAGFPDGVPACVMPKNGKVPVKSDKVYIDRCGPGNGWRYEQTSTGSFLFHSENDDDMCLQVGHGEGMLVGTKMRCYPCDRQSSYQRFNRVFDGYHYKITPESQSDYLRCPPWIYLGNR